LADQLDRDRGVGDDDDPVDGPRNGAEVRVTLHAFDFRGVGIHGNCFVAGVAQLAVDSVGRLSRFSGDARDGDALPAEELGNLHGYIDHRTSSCTLPGR
jgi:hypothetical protein